MKEWLDTRIQLLFTPIGMGVSIASFIIGVLISNLLSVT